MRCIRIWTGAEGNSHFAAGRIALAAGERGDALSSVSGAVSISFRETVSGGAFAWHDAPVRQLVITLSGQLEFTVRGGAQFTLGAGDVLLAEDTAGSGHSWRLVDSDPWRRAYIILAPGTAVPFVADATS